MTYGIKKSRSLPSINEGSRFETRKRSKSCDDLIELYNECSSERDNLIDRAGQQQLSEEEERNFNKIMVNYELKLKKYSYELENFVISRVKNGCSIEEFYKLKKYILNKAMEIKCHKQVLNSLSKKQIKKTNIINIINFINEFENLKVNFFNSNNLTNINEEEKKFIYCCICNELKLNNEKLYYNDNLNIDVESIRTDIIKKGLELAYECDNFDIINSLIKNEYTKKIIIEDKKYLFDFIEEKICKNDKEDEFETIKILIGDREIKDKFKTEFEYIMNFLNQAMFRNKSKTVEIFLNDKELLEAIISEDMTSNGSYIFWNLNRNCSCFKYGYIETAKVLLKNETIRKKMIEKDYIIYHFELAINRDQLEIIKEILNYKDIRNYILENKKNLILETFKKACEQKDTELIIMLLNDKKIAEEIISNDEKLDEYFKEIFAMSNLEVIESLIKNNFEFRKKTVVDFTHIKNKDADFTYIKNKDDFNKIKANFKAIFKKYDIDYNENSLFIEDDTIFLKKYIIDLEKINEKFTELSNEIKKRDNLLEVAKTVIEEEEKENTINEKIININNKIEVLKNINKECKKQVNINDNKQLQNFCIPAIKNSKNKNIFKEGFGGNTKFNKNCVKIKFDKDGFLRKTLENNPKTDKSILSILKNSLIIEHGKEWKNDKNSNKIELDTILMLFKKDPNIAFKMLMKLEEDKKIIIKKKGLLLTKKLQQNEKEELQKSFEEVVKTRQEICNIINAREKILNNNYINRETRETIKKITDFGIKIIKYNQKDIIGNKKSNIDINNIKQENINNIINFLSFIERNEDNIKNNEDKIDKILKNINNSINDIDNNNATDMIIALNNCIFNIDNFNKDISNNVAVLQQA